MPRLAVLAPLSVSLVGLVVSLGCAQPREPRAAQTAAIAELGPVPAGSAQVCVLRPDAMAAQVSMPVHDNGRLVGATRGTTFFCYLAATGEHQITSTDDDTGPTFLHAKTGIRYWLHQDVVELAGALHAHLDWVEEATALEMIDACDARVRVSVPGHDDETAAQPIAPAKKKL